MAPLPCFVTGWPLRPVGWGCWVVVVEVEEPWSLGCDWSVEWLELSWHLLVLEKGRGLEKADGDAQSRRKKGKAWSRSVSRWKARRRFWWSCVPGRCYHRQLKGAERSCSLSLKTNSLYWELERGSKRRTENERELKKRKVFEIIKKKKNSRDRRNSRGIK